MASARNDLRAFLFIVLAIAGWLTALLWLLESRASSAAPGDPVDIAQEFYRANYRRDFQAVAAYLSRPDRRARQQAGPAFMQESFTGFARELARKLAADVQLGILQQELGRERARVTLAYEIPATGEISSLLSWGNRKLNGLSTAEQKRILAGLDAANQPADLVKLKGQETFNFIKEDGEWRIFLDLMSATPVTFTAALPARDSLEVEFVQSSLFARADEPFQVDLKVRNRGPRELLARIDHRIKPRGHAGRLSMIACGFLTPLALQPGEERNISTAYLLDESFPRGAPLNITYAFQLQKSPGRGSR
jgi:hypothetical protein